MSDKDESLSKFDPNHQPIFLKTGKKLETRSQGSLMKEKNSSFDTHALEASDLSKLDLVIKLRVLNQRILKSENLQDLELAEKTIVSIMDDESINFSQRQLLTHFTLLCCNLSSIFYK